MRTPPEQVSVGDRLTQEEIEAAFDTAFGYRISGINPRRDSEDGQYVLVFATEDGPYDDAVTHGTFEYVGEGLEGDQSTSSPGNAVLVDAATDDVPVHFFYKGSDTTGWEYQGLVDVLGFEFRERGGREVIVFEMEHRDREPGWLDSVRNELERYRAERGDPVIALEELYAFSERRLAARFPENDHVRAKIRQQLQRLRDEGEIEFLDERGAYRITEEMSDVETEEPESEADLTDDGAGFTESRRRTRDDGFSGRVREAYGDTCAFCGRSRETPTGAPEVEAAHIYPKREGGADEVENGIALCKLHHWAFDTGWLALTDDHEILVADAPGREGYHEFKQLEGDTMRLPDEGPAPHPTVLAAHRDLYGF